MTSARVGTYGGGSCLLLTDGSGSLLLTDGSDLFASSVCFFSGFLVRATSFCSVVIKSFWRLICTRKSSVCRSRRSIFSESDNGSAIAGLKARQQAPTRALPIKLCVARKVTPDRAERLLQREPVRVLWHNWVPKGAVKWSPHPSCHEESTVTSISKRGDQSGGGFGNGAHVESVGD